MTIILVAAWLLVGVGATLILDWLGHVTGRPWVSAWPSQPTIADEAERWLSNR